MERIQLSACTRTSPEFSCQGSVPASRLPHDRNQYSQGRQRDGTADEDRGRAVAKLDPRGGGRDRDQGKQLVGTVDRNVDAGNRRAPTRIIL
jgi:hypothetical protein